MGLIASAHLAEWLVAQRQSLAFTTYQAGKLHLIGVGTDKRLSIFERTFTRAMGLAGTSDAQTVALATQHQIYRFDNVVPAGEMTPDGRDALYGPHQSWITGDLDVHDIGFLPDARPVFIATRFSCLATVSAGFSFKPLWLPPFVSELVPEDRCHLNGLAMEHGKPAYVTAVAATDTAEGWREHRLDGGVVVDVRSSEIVARGLSMPHSPRVHGGELYLLNSGRGEFGRVNLSSGEFEPIAFCPGFARGLAVHNGYAVIGLSLSRENRAFADLPLEEALQAGQTEPFCGLVIVELESGNIVHWLRIAGLIRELYDVAILPGVLRPALIGLQADDIKHVLSIDNQGLIDAEALTSRARPRPSPG